MRSGLRPLKVAYSGQPGHNKGFTIVETMIFLAVSSVILVSALLLVGGAQRKNEFNQGVRDLQQQINDVIDNVTTGYSASGANFTCSTASGVPAEAVGGSSTELGANDKCIFLGKVLQFNDNDNKFKVYSIIGRRTKPDNTVASTMADAQPRTITKLIDGKTIRNNLIPKKMTDSSGNLNAVGFLSTLNASGQSSGTQQIDMLAIRSGSTLASAATDQLDSWPTSRWNSLITGYDSGAWRNPSGGVKLCFEGPDANKTATITIGGTDQTTGTKLDFGIGSC